jgi:hypothetical protein
MKSTPGFVQVSLLDCKWKEPQTDDLTILIFFFSRKASGLKIAVAFISNTEINHH